jgi:hypothetical protein
MTACESVLGEKIDAGLDWLIKKRAEGQVSKVAETEEKAEPKNGRESLPPFLRSD